MSIEANHLKFMSHKSDVERSTDSILKNGIGIFERSLKKRKQRQNMKRKRSHEEMIHQQTPDNVQTSALDRKRKSSPQFVNDSPIYHIGCDAMAHCMSYLNPCEVNSFLTMPLSKMWRSTYTIPQDLWKTLCVSEPFHAKLKMFDGDCDDDNCSVSHFSLRSESVLQLGQYRRLYSSFVECIRFLDRIKETPIDDIKAASKNERQRYERSGSSDDDAHAIPQDTSCESETNKRKPPKTHHDKLLTSKVSDGLRHVDLPFSCATYSVVNWMVAFPEVRGIHIMCLKTLVCLLEGENQRIIAQRAGLADIISQGMVRFPACVELHTASLHALVLLTRSIGGKEGMVMYGTSAVSDVFNISTNSSRLNGIAILLDSMKRFSSHASLQAMGCWSMVNIALLHSQKSMLIRLGGISVILDAMIQHQHDEAVQFRALFALINIVTPHKSRNSETNASVVTQGDVHRRGEKSEAEIMKENVGRITNLVVTAMKNFWPNATIINRAILVLHNLSLSTEQHSAVLLTPDCQLMLEMTAKNFRRDQLVRRGARGTLSRLYATLMKDEGMRRRLVVINQMRQRRLVEVLRRAS